MCVETWTAAAHRSAVGGGDTVVRQSAHAARDAGTEHEVRPTVRPDQWMCSSSAVSSPALLRGEASTGGMTYGGITQVGGHIDAIIVLRGAGIGPLRADAIVAQGGTYSG